MQCFTLNKFLFSADNFSRNHPTLFLIKKRSTDAQYWTVTLSNWKKQPLEVFYKNAALKNFVTFTGKDLCQIFKNTYFEEHLHTAASELTLQSDFWNFVFGSHLKPSRHSNITKILVAFKPDLLKKYWRICCLYIWPLCFLVNLGFICSLLIFTTQKSNAFSPWTPCYKM